MKYTHSLWKAKVTDAIVRFVPTDDLPASGFASVYAFTEDDAKSMSHLDSYKHYRGSVYCPTLKIDTDTDEVAESTEQRLISLKVGFAKYSTGNRGFHFHVPRIIDPSHVLPALDRAYVTREFPGADVSFYHHIGWYRQVGATHLKTGLKKRWLAEQEGTVLDMRDERIFALPENIRNVRNLDVQSVFADKKLQIITVPYHNGERRKGLCSVAARLDDLGQPLDWAFSYLSNVNLMCEEPLEDAELRRILDWAYTQRVKG